MSPSPYRDPLSTQPSPLGSERAGSWGLPLPLLVLCVACLSRVGWALTQRGPFGAEPSLALLLAIVSGALLWQDLVALQRR